MRIPQEAFPRLTVDGLVVHEERLVCIRRAHPPFQGRPALPGGFVDLGEALEDAVRREVREETGLETAVAGLVGVYSDPGRDPRGHVVSVAYALDVVGGRLRAGTDAAEVVLLPLDDLPTLAFDHDRIVADGLRARGRPGAPATFASPFREGSQGGRGRR